MWANREEMAVRVRNTVDFPHPTMEIGTKIYFIFGYFMFVFLKGPIVGIFHAGKCHGSERILVLPFPRKFNIQKLKAIVEI